MTSRPNIISLRGSPKMYFSYGQFLVYDSCENAPGSEWKDEHVKQGFARREFSVSFGTIIQFGNAILRVLSGAYVKDDSHERVISVPLHVKSGEIKIEGPEEYPVSRSVLTRPGLYRITVAQTTINNDSVNIDLFIEQIAGDHAASCILLADSQLRPSAVLLENASIAGSK